MRSFLMYCKWPSIGSFFWLAQHCFERGNHLFNWSEIRRVGWLEQKLGNGTAAHVSIGQRHLCGLRDCP
jgi:hypothetical protein